MVGSYGPLSVDESLSIPQFMTKYNPDNVSSEKVVHIDTITGKSLTYGGLRSEAAKCAWGLRHNLGLKEGDVLSLLCPNSVSHSGLSSFTLCDAKANEQNRRILFCCATRRGGQVALCRKEAFWKATTDY
jgi:hypothetical protein